MAGTDSAQDSVLFVEGRDDKHVVQGLKTRLCPELQFDIKKKDGADALIESISREIAVPDRIAIGFVIDADNDPDARWQSVADRLRRRLPGVPPARDKKGTVVGDRPRVGVWLMPDNKGSGALEEFVAAMVPDGDPVWPLARKYIDDAEPYLLTGRSKAEVHAWLATRRRPFRMGEAIGAQALDTDGPLCRSFAVWLARLFG